MSNRSRYDPYEANPMYESLTYTSRLVKRSDYKDLLKVYSDIKAVPLFNSDNCFGDDFHYTTEKEMLDAIDFWLDKFKKKEFMRFAVIDNLTNEAIGTIELFERNSDDAFGNCGVMRLDLRSDYEKESEITKILRPFVHRAFKMFETENFITKAVGDAVERIRVLEDFGFKKSDKKLIGHDGTEYGDYYIYTKTVPVWENPPPLSEQDENFFDRLINDVLCFNPFCGKNEQLLPFSLNQAFAVYDISSATDKQIQLLYELVPEAILNCLDEGEKIYYCDWQHNLFLYDPRNPENCNGSKGCYISITDNGVVFFGNFYPDGDYYFHIEHSGKFGYLSHPWREEIRIFGDKFLKEFEKINEQIGFIPKVI